VSATPLSAAAVVGRTPVVLEPQLAGGRLLWLEQRPHEGGRTTLMLRSVLRSADAGTGNPAVELTPGDWTLRSRVHGYGGGAYAIAGGDLVWVHDGDRCLHHLPLDPASGQPLGAPRRLTAPGARAFGDGLIDGSRQRWIGVMEAGGHHQLRDQLVAVPLAGGEPEPLHQPADFCGSPALSPDGRQLAWVEWQHPFMPWERSQLWLASIAASGALEGARPVAGSSAADARGIAVFQPLWISATELVVASDASGWWNLQRLNTASGAWQELLPLDAEFAMPQWVAGMATSAWDGQALWAAACRDGAWQLGRVRLEPGLVGTPEAWQPLEQPFDDLAGLHAEAGLLVAVASNPTTPQGLLELEPATGTWRHTPVAPCPLPAEAISQPEPLWFAGHGGAPTHAWFYPPAGGAHPEAPPAGG